MWQHPIEPQNRLSTTALHKTHATPPSSLKPSFPENSPKDSTETKDNDPDTTLPNIGIQPPLSPSHLGLPCAFNQPSIYSIGPDEDIYMNPQVQLASDEDLLYAMSMLNTAGMSHYCALIYLTN